MPNTTTDEYLQWLDAAATMDGEPGPGSLRTVAYVVISIIAVVVMASLL